MRLRLILITALVALFLPTSFVLAGTVLDAYKYAWSNNVGYINFANVVVGDSALSGYAWSENKGWINFAPTQGGVVNDGRGNLSGSAWGEGLGWIDFGNAKIDPNTGRFSGTASGSLVGIINFDCPNYCDVRTDWGGSTPVVTTRRSGGSGQFSPGSVTPTSVISPVDVFTKNTDDGLAVVQLTPNILSNKGLVISIVSEPIADRSYYVSDDVKVVNNKFYNITAIDSFGNQIHEFSKPLTITLPIQNNYIGNKNLAVYWLNETNKEWVLVPDAVFTRDKVTFKVNHLTMFAIFEIPKGLFKSAIKPPIIKTVPASTLGLQNRPVSGFEFKGVFYSILFVALIVWLLKFFTKKF